MSALDKGARARPGAALPRLGRRAREREGQTSTQTEGAFDSDGSSQSETTQDSSHKGDGTDEDEEGYRVNPRRNGASSRRQSSSSHVPRGDGKGAGRSEYVLVEKRAPGGFSSGSQSPTTTMFPTGGARLAPSEEVKRSSWDGLRTGSASLWGASLIDALDGNLHSGSPTSSIASNKRRSLRVSPAAVRTRSRAPAADVSSLNVPSLDSPSPLLRNINLDSISTTFNPFAYYNFRLVLVPEVTLLFSALCFALYRLHSMVPTAVHVVIPPIPLYALYTLASTIPFITLVRQPSTYLKLPFTDMRAYRSESFADDGLATAICLPIVLAVACLLDAYANDLSTPDGIGLEGIKPLVQVWIEAGLQPVYSGVASELAYDTIATARVVFKARYELFLITCLNTAILLVHLALAKTVLKIKDLPTGNGKRFLGFMTIAGAISTTVWATLVAYETHIHELPVSPLEVGVASYIQQTSFYVISRLARRGFTLGELCTMTTAGTALCLEFWRLSRARWLFARGYPSVPASFRAATPIVVFQSVLIPGAFLSGFLLSPLLVISRHIAGKPSHRLKWPTERDRHRRLLALGVFVSLFGIVFLLLGGWASWMLAGGIERAWTWAFAFIFYPSTSNSTVELRDPNRRFQGWKRLFLVLYWGGTISVAVGGWTTRFVRARRIRMKSSQESTTSTKSSPSLNVDLTKGVKNVSEQGFSGVEGLREEKKVHASLNMRRKFFHALAVVMFIPGIAVDPAFTSLAFSVAFALFTFSEYARYFALYPIGAPLHIFFSEFVDYKDSGPVILSHFYLLTGCAGGLWLEGRGIKRFTGVLVLGVADALASIVGKLVGRVRWPGTAKTVEGSIAFVSSLVFCAWILRITNLVEHFSIPKYTLVSTMAALLEATSNQNDNLTIPLYMWSLLSLIEV